MLADAKMALDGSQGLVDVTDGNQYYQGIQCC
jgi:hypothetical protein